VLKDEVIQAVKDGLFHIYPITHVDEGIALLTGTAAGTVKDIHSVHGKVYRRLRAFYRKAMKGEG
jgi:predicted ATP-dependent protease